MLGIGNYVEKLLSQPTHCCMIVIVFNCRLLHCSTNRQGDVKMTWPIRRLHVCKLQPALTCWAHRKIMFSGRIYHRSGCNQTCKNASKPFSGVPPVMTPCQPVQSPTTSHATEVTHGLGVRWHNGLYRQKICCSSEQHLNVASCACTAAHQQQLTGTGSAEWRLLVPGSRPGARPYNH